jgi:hypothetical protein
MPCDFRVYGQTYREYFVLRNMKPVGPEIGRLGDAALHEVLEDQWGRHYRYVGVCPSARGAWEDRLNPGEFILPPGVVYRMLSGAKTAGGKRSSFLTWIRALAGHRHAADPSQQYVAEPAVSRRHARRGGGAAPSRGSSFSVGQARPSQSRKK